MLLVHSGGIVGGRGCYVLCEFLRVCLWLVCVLLQSCLSCQG